MEVPKKFKTLKTLFLGLTITLIYQLTKGIANEAGVEHLITSTRETSNLNVNLSNQYGHQNQSSPITFSTTSSSFKPFETTTTHSTTTTTTIPLTPPHKVIQYEMGHSNLYTIMKEAKYPSAASTHSSTNNINEFPVEPGHSQLYKIMREAKYPVSTNLTTSSTHSSLTNISSEPSKPTPQHYDFTTKMTTIGQQPQPLPQHEASHTNLYTIMKEVKDHEAAAAVAPSSSSSTATVISREANKKMAPHLPPQSVNNISSSSSLNQNFTPELGHSNLYTIMKEAKYPVHSNVNPNVTAAANQNRDFLNEQGHSNLYTVMKEAKDSSAVANKNINLVVITHFLICKYINILGDTS